MVVHSRLLLVLFSLQWNEIAASLLRGVLADDVVMARAPKASLEAAAFKPALVHTGTVGRRDVFDDDMVFEGDIEDDSSAEAQLERMHLNDLLGYSAKQAEESERTDVEASADGADEEDDADAEAAMDEAVQRHHNRFRRQERAEEEEEQEEEEDQQREAEQEDHDDYNDEEHNEHDRHRSVHDDYSDEEHTAHDTEYRQADN